MSIKREIYEVLEGNGAMTVYQIAKSLDRNYSTWLRNRVDEMVTIGDLKRIKRKSENGRPAYVYKIADERGSLRRQWQSEKLRGYPFTYEMWLEEKLKECRKRRGE